MQRRRSSAAPLAVAFNALPALAEDEADRSLRRTGAGRPMPRHRSGWPAAHRRGQRGRREGHRRARWDAVRPRANVSDAARPTAGQP
ncbi:MAG: hypothetical protein AVDCRST_MAG49-3459 [uncultured Thermomicrobiales bacterium]|uniref:Uncharacterized protein n=1 Tax=uncultured Thermomicrobiales bacterium TaxID=1645740 RepID=A0A6J4VA32_9BACT|nr:MAG: hypothetical protein AVDCRST_MAG49-3459 [uncultured Thermomicrobiales bacterium]